MTTGRINQVTILTGGPGREARGRPEEPPGGSQNRQVVGGGPKPGTRPGDPPGPEAPGGPRRAIQLPPLSSPGGGPPQGPLRARKGHPRAAACAPQEEDTSHRSRPEAATGFGLPPSVSRKDRHRPTIHRLQRSRRGESPPAGFRGRPAVSPSVPARAHPGHTERARPYGTTRI
ncbi:hypothetical protein MMC12_003570 [Toensbergia leucococca]|nr:hypothetical protein [Toensbergia leucococca]